MISRSIDREAPRLASESRILKYKRVENSMKDAGRDIVFKTVLP